MNAYAPSGEVAYDAGAVVYAQYGAYPVFVDPPSIALTAAGGLVTAAAVWLPFFSNVVGSVGGVGTETLDVGVLHTQSVVVNGSSPTFAINPGVPIRIVIQTPYAEGWDAYLNARPAFSGLWSCAPAPICTGVYVAGATLGTISITIPATNLQLITVGNAVFSLSLS